MLMVLRHILILLSERFKENIPVTVTNSITSPIPVVVVAADSELPAIGPSSDLKTALSPCESTSSYSFVGSYDCYRSVDRSSPPVAGD
jgi:hypothetical protein